MATATHGDTVQVHYTGKLTDGTVFDSSLERAPLQFAIGQGNVIPGFEQAVVGMTPGETKTETIASEQAYGPRRPELVLAVDRQQVPPDLDLQVGQQLQISHPSGQAIPAMVVEISDQKVTLDANHPLAGEPLTFDIQLVAIGE